jgi:hypothetical protein
MATIASYKKYDGQPKTMEEVLKEFVWSDWDLLEDMAKNATDENTLIHLIEAASVCWGSLDEGMSDRGYEILYILKKRYNTLPEKAKILLDDKLADDPNEDTDEDGCTTKMCKSCDLDCGTRRADYIEKN